LENEIETVAHLVSTAQEQAKTILDLREKLDKVDILATEIVKTLELFMQQAGKFNLIGC
jgi:hypothetical protein